MTLSDFRCHFQALSPPIMKRYASMFVSHDERKVSSRSGAQHHVCDLHLWINRMFLSLSSQAVEELLVELDLDKRSIVVGASRVRTCSDSAKSNSRAWVRADVTHGSSSWLMRLRCSWSEVCCVTWSSRGTSRSPAGWSICRPPAWDTWPGRSTANSRSVSRWETPHFYRSSAATNWCYHWLMSWVWFLKSLKSSTDSHKHRGESDLQPED